MGSRLYRYVLMLKPKHKQNVSFIQTINYNKSINNDILKGCYVAQETLDLTIFTLNIQTP